MTQGKEKIRVDKNDEGKITVEVENSEIEYTLEALSIDRSILEYRGIDKYSPEQKITAAMYYLVEGGNAQRVSKKTGIPPSTIRKWKSTAPWWDEVMAKCRAIKQDELDAMFTMVIHETVDEVQDRIKNGDFKLDKDGNKVRIPMTGRDLAQTISVLFDKRSLLRGDPTAIKRQESPTSQLKTIQEKLLKTLEDAKAKDVVSEQKPEFLEEK